MGAPYRKIEGPDRGGGIGPDTPIGGPKWICTLKPDRVSQTSGGMYMLFTHEYTLYISPMEAPASHLQIFFWEIFSSKFYPKWRFFDRGVSGHR